MKAFITGGTGFIGGRVARLLLERGDEVVALVRSEQSGAALKAVGARLVLGDLHDLPALREGMRGCDVVFHIAGWYKVGSPDWPEAEKVNVEGTRNVLGLAYELDIPKIVYTSTLAVYGDTHGQMVDESYRMPAGQTFLTEYDHTKWRAHFEVVAPLVEKGAPVVIVLPGAVYGPGDNSLISELMKWYLRGWLPVLPGGDTVLTYAYIDDIAQGHLLAAEKGQPGEDYILAGPAMSVVEASNLWARLTGRPAPFFSIPGRFLAPFAPLMGAISNWLPLPQLFSQDVVAILGATYTARPDKAMRQLGWRPRPPEEGMRLTLDTLTGQVQAPPPETVRRNQMTWLALIALGGILLTRLLRPRRRRRR